MPCDGVGKGSGDGLDGPYQRHGGRALDVRIDWVHVLDVHESAMRRVRPKVTCDEAAEMLGDLESHLQQRQQ